MTTAADRLRLPKKYNNAAAMNLQLFDAVHTGNETNQYEKYIVSNKKRGKIKKKS